MATVWDLGNYFDDQTGKILDGTWEGGGSDVIAMGADKGTPHLTGWGDFVPADVREKIEATADEIIAGKEVIVGPIYDEKGVLKFKEGEQVSDQFLGYEWKWFVKGVVTAS
jgi:basic membrane lipoprotein Med (substrate-binding protein (PBP1-ABC) superfamily)